MFSSLDFFINSSCPSLTLIVHYMGLVQQSCNFTAERTRLQKLLSLVWYKMWSMAFVSLCYSCLGELLMNCMCLSHKLRVNLQLSDWMSLLCFSMYAFLFQIDRQSNHSRRRVVLPLQAQPNDRRMDGHINMHIFAWQGEHFFL